MTDPKKSRITFLLDRSGSMIAIKTDTEGGLRAFLKTSAEVPDVETRATLADFDTEFRYVYQNVPLAEAPDYVLEPRGGTALYDSLARVITDLGKELNVLPEDERPGTVQVVILTDGEENSSREWRDPNKLKALIVEQTDKYGWQFVFLGANQDAVLSARNIGISQDFALTYSGQNVGAAVASAALRTNSYRGAVAGGQSYAEAADASGFTDEDREAAVKDTTN